MNGECGRWVVELVEGTPAAIHALDPPPKPVPTIWVVELTAPALILGSTQSSDVVDSVAAALADIAVVRRRSGGGAVLVDVESILWVDIILPVGDRLWSSDLGMAPLWIGHVWAEVAQGLDMAAEVHTGPMQADELGRRVCFCGRAPGEVTVHGRKLVGISQRRTRDCARFQCAFLLKWQADRLIGLIEGVADDDVQRVRSSAIGSEASREEVLKLFLAAIANR